LANKLISFSLFFSRASDVHYLDGAKHFDEYMLTMTNENNLPDPLRGYALDKEWETERWSQVPWYDAYLSHQSADDAFWTNNSVRFSYDTIRVPVYLLAGLFDAYKDFGLDVFTGIRAVGGAQPLKLAIVPTQHDFCWESDNAPAYDDRLEMVRWFRQFLTADGDGSVLADKPVTVFVRDAALPSAGFSSPLDGGRNISGNFFGVTLEQLEAARQTKRLLLSGNGRLVESPGDVVGAVLTQSQAPTLGLEQGEGWEDFPPSFTAVDAKSLTFDWNLTDGDVTLVGFARVALNVSVAFGGGQSEGIAQWTLRLEEVSSGGVSNEVTGVTMNSAYADGSRVPKKTQANVWQLVVFRLHFNSYTFKRGNVLRLAFCNGEWRAWNAFPVPFVFARVGR
jgi:predicted acyl esterase